MTPGHQGVGRYRRENLNLSRRFASHEQPPHLWYIASYHHSPTDPFFNTLPEFFTALVPTIGTPSGVTITGNPDV